VRYRIVDVFTDRPLAGNALCVVLDPCPEERMQTVAREMNLSETTFVTERGEGTYSMRIFTPGVELPFAGHPTLGTACGDLRPAPRSHHPGGSQGGMAGEGKLHAGGEDAHRVRTLTPLGDEGGLAEVHLPRDRLHALLGAGVEHNAERVARQRLVGEDVDDPIAHPLILRRRAGRARLRLRVLPVIMSGDFTTRMAP
jgi:hypothetical protein